MRNLETLTDGATIFRGSFLHHLATFPHCGLYDFKKVLKKRSTPYSQIIFFKLALGGGALDRSRDTHCATCHELVILKSYLASFTNATCFYLNLEIILNQFENVT